jgi:glycosyltransferase involved in cell wall biosynthesis
MSETRPLPPLEQLVAPDRVEASSEGCLPTFSVLIPAYQAEDTLAEAVESALGQTVAPIEVIVCDDGSTDGTAQVLVPYRDRIVYLRKPNGGGASALNAAFRVALAEYVVVLDSDDAFFPRRLEVLSEVLRARPDLDVLTTDAYVELDGRRLRRVYSQGWRFDADDQRAAILRRNFLFNHAAIKRRRVEEAGGWDESFRVAYDWDLWVRLVLAGARIGLVAEPLSRYRIGSESLSANRVALARECVGVLEKAQTNSSLTHADRVVLKDSLADFRRRLQRVELGEALSVRASDVRRRALSIATDSGFRARTRAKAAAVALAPRLASRLARRRSSKSWIGAGGTVVQAGEPFRS